MNLISCNCCAVVFDKKKLEFPSVEDLVREDGEYDEEKGAWSQVRGEFVPKCQCPVCRMNILDEGD